MLGGQTSAVGRVSVKTQIHIIGEGHLINWSKSKFEVKEKNGFKFIVPDWASGSVLMLSKEWFHKLGGWSEEFWMYSEDVDICKKSILRNGKTALLTDAEIFHKHGGASRVNIKTTAMAKAEVIKSKHVYFQKYFTGFANIFSQSVLIFLFLFIKLPMALLGILFFFIPKLLLQTEIFKNLVNYYMKVILTKNWQSEKVRQN